MTWRGHGSTWAYGLSPEQVATVRRTRLDFNGSRSGYQHHGADGWKVYMQPTTLPARYLELRHYQADGVVSVWVIERDGTISDHYNRDGADLRLRSAT